MCYGGDGSNAEGFVDDYIHSLSNQCFCHATEWYCKLLCSLKFIPEICKSFIL